jgi:hypothetical protein
MFADEWRQGPRPTEQQVALLTWEMNKARRAFQSEAKLKQALREPYFNRLRQLERALADIEDHIAWITGFWRKEPGLRIDPDGGEETGEDVLKRLLDAARQTRGLIEVERRAPGEHEATWQAGAHSFGKLIHDVCRAAGGGHLSATSSEGPFTRLIARVLTEVDGKVYTTGQVAQAFKRRPPPWYKAIRRGVPDT